MPAARDWSFPCHGCGEVLTQRGRKGSLRRYHHECQVVTRAWRRREYLTRARQRYHALVALGAFPRVAAMASSSDFAMTAMADVLSELSEKPGEVPAPSRARALQEEDHRCPARS